jgi:hypothetical protein
MAYDEQRSAYFQSRELLNICTHPCHDHQDIVQAKLAQLDLRKNAESENHGSNGDRRPHSPGQGWAWVICVIEAHRGRSAAAKQ